MTEAQGLLLVMQTPVAGREQEHQDWYVTTHLPDVCGVPGAIRGEFTAALPAESAPRWSHAAAYWTDGDPAAFVGEVFRRAGSGAWKLSDTIDPASTLMTIAAAIGPRALSPVTANVAPADRVLYIVLTNATPGDDEEFNRWYSDTHIPDVLDVPGFVAAQRFRFVDHPALQGNPFGYAALYEIRADVVGEALAELAARAGTERMVLSPTLATDELHAVVFAPLGIVAGGA